MPSVPQSLLWISLVVLWLFVLVPMLISKRDAVRRTSDVALATRVLNGAASVRKLRRVSPAAGHFSDPDFQSDKDEDVDDLDDVDEAPVKAVVVATDTVEGVQEYLDVEIIDENAGVLLAGAPAEAVEEVEEPEPVAAEDEAEDESVEDGTAAEYEYVEDTSGLASEDEPPAVTSISSRRRMYESKTAAAVSARKFQFRKRVLLAMTVCLVATTTAALTVWPAGWWACGSAAIVTFVYLAYLRRQTRIEERLRRRRQQRMARARLGVENTGDAAYDLVPSRLRRPGSVVLEIDDEDPIFEHLDYAPGPVDYRLPHAAGQ